MVCEVAAACCVDERTADVLLHEALELLGLPALVAAVDAGLLRLPHARVVLEEVRACEPPLAALVVADVLTRVSDQAPAAVRQIVRRAINRADPAAAEALIRRRTQAGLLLPVDLAAVGLPSLSGTGFTSDHYRVVTTVTVGDTTQRLTSNLARMRSVEGPEVLVRGRQRTAG